MLNNQRFGLLLGLTLLGSFAPSGAGAQSTPDVSRFEFNAESHVIVTQNGPPLPCPITADDTAVLFDVAAYVGEEYEATNHVTCGSVNLMFEYKLKVTQVGYDEFGDRATAADLTLNVIIYHPNSEPLPAFEFSEENVALPPRGESLWITGPITSFPGVFFDQGTVQFNRIGA